MKRFQDQLAVVMGGGSGMGRGVSHRLAQEGAHVAVVDLNPESADRVRDEIREAGGIASSRALDASDIDGIREYYAELDAEHGRIDVLHHQVGIPGTRGIDVDPANFDRIVAVNQKSAFYVTTLAFPLLKKSRGNRAITITSSISGINGSKQSPLYSLTKGSILAFAKSLALTGATDRIRVNVVCPGLFDTPMLADFFGGQDLTIEEAKDRAAAAIPLGRPGDPGELAGAVAFLNSPDASYITGAIIPVDGGLLAR